MIYLVALLAGFGGVIIGWNMGFALFAVTFEVLRQLDRDILVDSPSALAAFRLPASAIGYAIAAWLTWRWRPQPAADWWKTLTVAVLAGAGGALLTHLLQVGRIAATISGRHSDVILFDLGGAVSAWIAGAVLAAMTFDRAAPAAMRVVRGALGIAGALALIFAGLITDFRLGHRYADLGQPRIALFEIRMPTATSEVPPVQAVRVALRTGTAVTQAHSTVWLRRDGRVFLSGRVDITERTRERVLTVAIPGLPELTVRMDFVGNPPIMYGYSPWQPLGPDGSLAIRFLTRRAI